jgi:hypothetical protein
MTKQWEKLSNDRTRNLLHESKLEDFKRWLLTQGYELMHVPDSSKYEVMRIKAKSVFAMPSISFYQRTRTEHITTYGLGTQLVVRWLKERDDA